MLIIKLAPTFRWKVLNIDMLQYCRQHFNRRQDLQLVDSVGVNPFLDPTPDCREIRRRTNEQCFVSMWTCANAKS